MRNTESSIKKVRQGILLFILLFLLPPTIFSQKKSDPVSFIQLTDTHICNLEGYNSKFVQKRQHYGQGVEPLLKFLGTVPEKFQSDFVVITGDMIDFFEAENTSGEMEGKQIEQFIDILRTNEIHCYLTLGNHDIGSYPVYKALYHQYNAEKARACWTRNADCFRDGTYYCRTLQVENTTYRLIFLDNAYYLPDRGENDTPYIIDQMQLLWLDNEMRKSKDDVEILFMHMPIRGGVEVGNIKSESSDQTIVNTSCGLYKVLEQNSSARLIVAGHRHQNVIHEFKMSDDYTLTQVQTGAFARDPRNWRLIQLSADGIMISYPGEENAELILPLN